jgi:HK97 family phage prohead protease/HK97 family phage major capsid protein
MTELLRRTYRGELRVRAAGDGSDERIIEGVVVPFGEVIDVQDSPNGPRYRETIDPGATGDVVPERVTLVSLDAPGQEHNTHQGARLVGRGISASTDQARLHMGFRVARTVAGDELLELARDGVLTELSAEFRPVEERRRPDGVVARSRIDVRRVAVVERGAYDAPITAVRAAQEGAMPASTPAAQGDPTDDELEQDAPATPPASSGDRPNRTRVTVDVERAERELELARAAAERETVGALARGAGPRSSISITRPEQVYGPSSSHSFLRDRFRASLGDWEAAQRVQRHDGMLGELAESIERSAAWDWQSGTLQRSFQGGTLARAGDVLSAELGGAIPTDFVPGLLTPRILKGRPMGDFYDRYPIADARPRTFPKVTTSTAVAVQSAEGAALGSTDFATTAVTVQPLMYGAYTDVSRQSLDGADPAAQAMLMQDLMEAYGQASETVIKTAVEAGSTASGVAITAATPYAGTLANVINYYAVRFRGATGAFIPSALFPVLAAQGDTTGRPFLPMIGATNSDGVTLADDVELALAVLTARSKLSYASTANVNVFGRPTDFVTFESSVASFSFDQVVGPQAVRIGIWAYLVVGARLGSLKVTAA